MAWLCNALVWSRCSTCQDVCKPCRGKGITEYRAAECHLFCVKLGENATTTHGQLQQAFGHHAMSKEQAFRWHDMFSEGRTLVEDGQRSGRPSTTRIGDNAARVREHVRSEDWVRMIPVEVNIPGKPLIWSRLLGMRKMCAKMVPRNLIE